MTHQKIAIIDDYQNIALSMADWTDVQRQADVQVFNQPWKSEEELIRELQPFDVIVLMRERTAFPAHVIARLPKLKLIAMTGSRTSTLDINACTERGILVSYTTSPPSFATAELAIALMLACSRALPQGLRNMSQGLWQESLPVGTKLEGKRLGIVGLGRLGSKVAHIAQAFGMDVVAWSQNLTNESAAAQGVQRVEKAELFATSDVVSIHLTLSDRTLRIIGRDELSLMKQGAILVNTARGPLVDETALLEMLRSQHITAGLDVFDAEPLPKEHPFRSLPNVVVTPHLGYVVADALEHHYRESVENVSAYIAGTLQRLKNPEVVQTGAS